MKIFKAYICHPVALVAMAFTCAMAVGMPATMGRLTGTVTNSTNTVMSEKSALGTCTAAARARGAYFVLPLADAPGSTVAAGASNNSIPGVYNNTSGIEYRNRDSACPRDEDYAITLDGSTGYVAGPINTQTNPVNYTLQIWFKTTTTRGGRIIGFSASRTGQSNNYDRHVYMRDDGRLTYGVNPNPVRTITSPNAYNDGEWHSVIVTQSNSLFTNRGMRMYVDGSLVAGNPNVVTAENYTGTWRIGYDNLTGWPSPPTSYFFAGSLSYAAYYPSVLTQAQITVLNDAGLN